MAPSTRSKRTLAEADPNADMGARAKKATKGTTSAKKVPAKGKTTTKKDAKSKTTAKETSQGKESEGCDRCAGCGKGLAADEGVLVNEKGDLETVAKTGKEKKKEADKVIAEADVNAGGKKGESATGSTARGKAKGKEAAEKSDKTTGKTAAKPAAKRGKKAAAELIDGGEEVDLGTQNNAGGESGSAKANTGAKKTTAKASGSKKVSTSEGTAKSTNASSKSSKATKSAPSYEWVTVCRPQFDIEKEDEENDDEDEDEEVNLRNDPRYTHFDKKTCKCGKAPEESPGYTWVFTKAGYDQFLYWFDEQRKRDQDGFSMHIFSDFSGNGIVEVMENQFIDFNKESLKMKPQILSLWSQVEGIAVWLNTYLCQWGEIEDADRKNARIVALYGTLILSTISLLIKKNEFREDGTIKNLGLILGLFIAFATSSGSTFCDEDNEGLGNDGWTKRVLQLASKHGVKIAGPWGIEKEIAEIEGEMDTDDEVSVDGNGGLDVLLSSEDLKSIVVPAVDDDGAEDWEDEEDEGEVRDWKTWNWKKEVSLGRLPLVDVTDADL
ncbi:hypothetical protein MMC30_005038 [Trapelia coarctata]|nr:hypothetical protein [Trapelia coarctata]